MQVTMGAWIEAGKSTSVEEAILALAHAATFARGRIRNGGDPDERLLTVDVGQARERVIAGTLVTVVLTPPGKATEHILVTP